MTKKLNIAAVSGSLNSTSISKKFIKEIEALVGDKASISEVIYKDVPVFNQEFEFPTPVAVENLRSDLAAADAIIIVMPEYNLGIPGSLKNMLDWMSRPAKPGDAKPVLDYPILVLSFSAGISGGMVPQEQLRSLLGYLGANVMPQPRASFTNVFAMLDETGNLALDDTSKGFLEDNVNAFLSYAGKFVK